MLTAVETFDMNRRPKNLAAVALGQRGGKVRAARLLDSASRAPSSVEKRSKDPDAVALGQRGGKARAAALSRPELVAIARLAAAARWKLLRSAAPFRRGPGRPTRVRPWMVIAALHQAKDNVREAAKFAKIPLTTFKRHHLQIRLTDLGVTDVHHHRERSNRAARPRQTKSILGRSRIGSGPSGNDYRLDRAHQKYLESAGLSAEVIRARGYRSSHCGLSIPLNPVFGLPRMAIRQEDGTYAAPSPTAKAIVDVSPAGWKMVFDRARPLFVADGPIEADAAISQRIACVSVHPQLLCRKPWPWEEIGVSGRDIYLAFAPRSRAARRAESTLAEFLIEKGARIHVLSLPMELCTFLHDGSGEAELIGLAADGLERV